MDFTVPYELKALANSLKKFIANEIKPLEDANRDENGIISE